MADAYGLVIRNSNRQVIVNEYFKNFTLREKISFTHDTFEGGTYYLEADLPASPSAAVAFRSTGGWCGIYYSDQISSTVRRIRWASRSPIAIVVYIFDNPLYANLSGGWGLRVRNRYTSEVSFDSRGKYMKVLAQDTVTANPGSGDYNRFNFPGKELAVIFMQPYAYTYSRIIGTPAGPNTIHEIGREMMMCFDVAAEMRLQINEWFLRVGRGQIIETYMYNGSKAVIIVDVTGM